MPPNISNKYILCLTTPVKVMVEMYLEHNVHFNLKSILSVSTPTQHYKYNNRLLLIALTLELQSLQIEKQRQRTKLVYSPSVQFLDKKIILNMKLVFN